MMRSSFLSVFVSAIFFLTPSFAAERVQLTGQYVQGGTIIGKGEPGVRVSLDGAPIMVTLDGDFIFGFDRDHKGASTLEVTHADGDVETLTFDIAGRDYNIERIDGLPDSKVTPRTPEQIAHIQRDVQMKKDAKQNPSQRVWFDEPFDWPVTGRISGNYGSQRILNGEPRRPHYGVDIAAPQDTDFFAPAGGVVTLANNDMYFEGGLIFLDHGLGYVSGFLHMNRVDVKAGDVVKKGDLLGGVGSAGRSTGPHLDWRINWMGRQVDPTLLVSSMEEAIAAKNTATPDLTPASVGGNDD